MSSNNLVEKAKRDVFDTEIKRRLGDFLNLLKRSPREATDPANDFDFEDEPDPLLAE